MPETPAFLSERLENEGAKTHDFFASLTVEQWRTEVYTEGATWDARNVLAHFVMADESFLRLFVNVNDGGPGLPEDFDLDAYNARHQQRTAELTPQELLDRFKTAREQMVAWVAILSSADLEKQGRHSLLGVTTLAKMIKTVYHHNQIHLRDLRHALEH